MRPSLFIRHTVTMAIHCFLAWAAIGLMLSHFSMPTYSARQDINHLKRDKLMEYVF